MVKTRKNRRGRKSKRSKYIMKGCSRKRCRMLGGSSFYKPAAPVPAPLVGQPWTYDKWPGSGGITGNRNYFPLDKYIVDPQTRMHIRGGGSRSNRKRSGGYKYKYKGKKGGAASLMTGISNLFAESKYNISSINNKLQGFPPGKSPLPYEQPTTYEKIVV